MRESRKMEKTRFPADTTELWLESQRSPLHGRRAHKKAPDDVFEAWIRKRVEDALEQIKEATR